MKKGKAFPPAVMARVAELQKKHKEVQVIECDGKYGYLRKPDRKIIKMAWAMAEDKITEAEIILENCWLDGDEELKDDDDLFLSIMPEVFGMMEFKAARLKKFSRNQN